jgi:DUF4097 and DUF4098 domain-containing protein YvlB
MLEGTAEPRSQQARVVADDEWCRDVGTDRDRQRHCEVREVTLPAPRLLEIRDVANGSLSVTGGSRSDVRLRGRVTAWARTLDEARQLASAVTIDTTDGRVTATGPRGERDRGWSVSYRAEVPSAQDVDLSTANGSIAIAALRSRVRAATANGSVRLTDSSGDVDVSSSNGSITIELSGDTWEGAGLRATSSNGSVRLDVPASYNARLRAGTRNGSISTDFPLMVQGRLRDDLDATLGKGGPTLDLRTANGSIRVGRR